MFWTDATQAQERLLSSSVCYDKEPVFIEDIQQNDRGIVASTVCLSSNKRKDISLDDPKWNNFRDLPQLGWTNFIRKNKLYAVFLERRSTRTRTHGLARNNTKVLEWFFNYENPSLEQSRNYNLTTVLKNEAYLETLKDTTKFPKTSEIVGSLPQGQAVAISPLFCIVRTQEGIRWLYRKKDRVGFFTGVQTISLLPQQAFYREELLECPSFDIPNIQEF